MRFYFGTGPSSLDYWRVVAGAKQATIAEVTSEAGVTMPRPLPSTARAWSAFMRVYNCRHAGLNGYLGPCWADIKAVLEVWGDWGPTIQRQLGTCFNEVMRIDSAARAEKQAQEKAKQRTRGRGTVRPRARGRR